MVLGFILGFIITVISFILGVTFCLYFSKSDTFERIADRIPKKKEPTIGLIERPDAETIRKRGTLEEETEEEMSKVLRKVYPKK